MMDYTLDERDRYEKSISKLMRASQSPSGYGRDVINATLDDLISIDYMNARFIRSESLNPVICKTTHLIPLDDDLLLTKFSQWLATVANNKDVRFNKVTIDTLCRFLLQAFHQSPEWAQPEILRAVGAVLYENGAGCPQFLDELLLSGVEEGLLILLLRSSNSEVKRTAMQCIGNVCMKNESGDVIDELYLKSGYQNVLSVLHEGHDTTEDDTTYLRLLLASLKCLQNILGASKTVHMSDLGKVLAALKSFMLLGLPGIGINPPVQPSLLPSSFFMQEKSPAANSPSRKDIKDVTSTPSTGKKSKRKPKRGKQTKEAETGDVSMATGGESSNAVSDDVDVFERSWPVPGKISSSESEYSDTEGGVMSKLRSLSGKVRHASLGCLHTLFKNTEKKVLFGYWSFFVPDAPLAVAGGPPPQTLFTSILKENNAKCRAGSVMVLSALLEGSKQFLFAAEERENNQTAFTAFSQTLVSMIKEIHRCLQLSLAAETYGSNITQIIKCMSILVSNVPYHKLNKGLLNKVVRSMKPFYQHKDNRVRTACLTCLGAVVSASAPLPEVFELLTDTKFTKGDGSETLFTRQDRREGPLSWRDDPEESKVKDKKRTDREGMSWLLQWCSDIITGGEEPVKDPLSTIEVLPVRLEALQVLTQIIKHYFDLVHPYLGQLTVVIQTCLMRGDDDQVRLHGLKVLEELGKSMLQKLTEETVSGSKLAVHQVVEVWNGVLSGALPSVLQDTSHLVLQASACDCLGTIGPLTMEILPVHHRILIMTVLLGLVNEEDYRLKMASIRALGIIVQYPCLREDVTFVADTANAILGCMQHSSINVRMRAAWSLGNLCDALHSNIQNGDCNFLQAFSELLLQRLLEAAVNGAADHDKVKSNSVRALGLLGRILEAHTLKKSVFQSLINKAVQVLLRNINTGAMKVRWNSCYALGNFFRNPNLPADGGAWQEDIFTSFTKLLVSCKNFKLCQAIVHLSGILNKEDICVILQDTIQMEKEELLITNIKSYASTLRDQKSKTSGNDEDRLFDAAQALRKLESAIENTSTLLQGISESQQQVIMRGLEAAMKNVSMSAPESQEQMN
ncbi:putative HEAT repeat-containing protein 6 [Apostichopus japonicus]|uniref:HEAT repeat-containing protein 6 n=1 Tax=Stichopus japonicus TaxID=307972 RepID=A0A2G8KI92_STIJA|nr:putative HEAT repeat-containing protein 6 [Apostichopus japonicus]